ncbi:MAG: hypothetical protein V2B18_03140 [Pseudomonadota bacterium]
MPVISEGKTLGRLGSLSKRLSVSRSHIRHALTTLPDGFSGGFRIGRDKVEEFCYR